MNVHFHRKFYTIFESIFCSAHCLKDRESTDVIVGAHHLHDRRESTRQTQTVDSSYLFPHPHWKPHEGKGRDIGIVKVPEPFELNEYVALVSLPYNLGDETFAGELAKISGWGKIDDNPYDHAGLLRAVENPIISNAECKRHTHSTVVNGNICMSGKGGRRTCR
jgi:hypothetical protein